MLGLNTIQKILYLVIVAFIPLSILATSYGRRFSLDRAIEDFGVFVIIFVLVYAMYLFKSEKWKKKILEYNKPENVKRRLNKITKWLLGLNNIQKVLLLVSIALWLYAIELDIYNQPYYNNEYALGEGAFYFFLSLVGFFGIFLFKDKNK